MDCKKLKFLFSDMICSDCGAEFEEHSFEFVEKQGSTFVVKLTCRKCSKDFGLVFINLGQNKKDIKPFIIRKTPKIISKDEVLDAHKFIKNLKHDWKKHIPKDFIQK